MAESKMKEVAKILGVELGEEFYLKELGYTYKLTKDGIYSEVNSPTPNILYKLLIGTLEIKKPILDKVEKRYLENVLRPFKNRDISIMKLENYRGQMLEIYFCEENDVLAMPYFKNETMYIGLELNKKYTLEELELFEK